MNARLYISPFWQFQFQNIILHQQPGMVLWINLDNIWGKHNLWHVMHETYTKNYIPWDIVRCIRLSIPWYMSVEPTIIMGRDEWVYLEQGYVINLPNRALGTCLLPTSPLLYTFNAAEMSWHISQLWKKLHQVVLGASIKNTLQRLMWIVWCYWVRKCWKQLISIIFIHRKFDTFLVFCSTSRDAIYSWMTNVCIFKMNMDKICRLLWIHPVTVATRDHSAHVLSR